MGKPKKPRVWRKWAALCEIKGCPCRVYLTRKEMLAAWGRKSMAPWMIRVEIKEVSRV